MRYVQITIGSVTYDVLSTGRVQSDGTAMVTIRATGTYNVPRAVRLEVTW